MNNGGHIYSYRSDRDHWTWKDPYYRWWADIRFEVNFKPGGEHIKGKYIECSRGQSIRSITKWAYRWGTDRNRVKRFFDLLIAHKEISIEVIPNRTIRLTILNYNYISPRKDTSRSMGARDTEDRIPLDGHLDSKKCTTYTPTGTMDTEYCRPPSKKKMYHNRKKEDSYLTQVSLWIKC